MRTGRMRGWSEHSPDGDRNQSGGQDGPGDESFPHLVESVAVMKSRAPESCTANRGNPMNSFTGENGWRKANQCRASALNRHAS